MPPIAIVLTLLGLVPFIACGLAAIGSNPDPADRMLGALIDYAAIILAFSGGIYWALSLLSTQPEPPPQRWRLAFGVVPPLLGWLALLLGAWLAPWIALVVLIAGYILTAVVERQTGQHSTLPRQYVWLRWGFTIVSVAMMTTVLTLRLLGQTIVF
ncbi:MAG: DUF3429 domain-containing protein [Acetobacteraceae bacterium]